MNINFVYWIPIFLFGSAYLVKLCKNIFEIFLTEKEIELKK